MRRLLHSLLAAAAVSSGAVSEPFHIPIHDLRVRDPFVYADPATKLYYLYAQTGNRRVDPQPGLGIEVYRSRDLTSWSEPVVLRAPPPIAGYLFAHLTQGDYGRLSPEQYPGVQYTLATAPRLEGPWHEIHIGEYSVPAGARHGCMIPLSQAEFDALQAGYERP